jgi:RNA polymerase-binding transcription factor DksA
MDQDKLEGFRGALTEELALVDRQLADHGVAEDGIDVGVDDGFADSAQASAERSEIVGAIQQLIAHRAEVAAALERIDAGTYGICESCGRPIDIERLEALPSVRLCVTCKAARS